MPLRRSPRLPGPVFAAATEARLLHQLGERSLDAGEALALGQLEGGRAGDHDDVVRWVEAGAQLREPFAQKPLDAIALDRAANLARNREAKAGTLRGRIR